jgi:hypothetical protein
LIVGISSRRVSEYVGGKDAISASDESTPPLHYYHIFGAASRRAVGSGAVTAMEGGPIDLRVIHPTEILVLGAFLN